MYRVPDFNLTPSLWSPSSTTFLSCLLHMLPPRPSFVPSLSHSHPDHPIHPAGRRPPHVKSTVATSHHPPQPPPSPTIKLCNRKQGGVIQRGGRQNVMGGGEREQDSIRERTVRGSGATVTAACATNRWWSTPDSVGPRTNRAHCCHLVIGLQVLPSLCMTLSLAESIEVSVVDNRLANQNFARPKG